MADLRQQATQRAYYDTGLADYEKPGWLRRGLTYAYQRKAAILARAIGAPAACLEVGAGSGLLTYYLRQQWPAARLTANDLSPAMLDAARARVPDIRLHCGDAADLRLPAASFDAIVGVDVLHHLPDPVAALAEWRRVTMPGGRLAILESNAWNPLNLRNIGVEHEVRSFLNTPGNLQQWAAAAGWGAVAVTPAPSFTPSGPRVLRPLLNVVDAIGPHVPGVRRLTALWLLTGHA